VNDKELLSSPLAGRVIALPESRQLDVLAALFERRQARVIRVPLVAIHDTPDQATVLAWLQSFIASPPDLLIALTGEGLRRLRGAAERNDIEAEFMAALDGIQVLSRGPKPAKALREMGLSAPQLAMAPTTDGVIQSLEQMSLRGQTIAVQLYGEDPNEKLMSFLQEQGLAAISKVAPYVYADQSATREVIDLIASLASCEIEMIAFTSKPQLRRLLSVARSSELMEDLHKGMERTLVAAIGPVVGQELHQAGFPVSVMPQSSYFMKPLVRAAEQAFSKETS